MRLTILYQIKNQLFIILLILGLFLQACQVTEGESEHAHPSTPPPPKPGMVEGQQPALQGAWRQYYKEDHKTGNSYTKEEWPSTKIPNSSLKIQDIVEQKNGSYFIHRTDTKNLKSIQRSGLIVDKVGTGLCKGKTQFIIRDTYLQAIWLSYAGTNAGETMEEDDDDDEKEKKPASKVDLKIKLTPEFILSYVRDSNVVLYNKWDENGNTAVCFKNIPPECIFIDVLSSTAPTNIKGLHF